MNAQPPPSARSPAMHRLRSPLALVPVPSPPSCSSASRRRTRPAPRRRRPTLRTDRGPHLFDQLPWVSALEAAPQHTSPWDIADLSLIADPENMPASGPVRRRKTSTRSNPMGSLPSSPDSPPPLTPCDTNSPLFGPATPHPTFSPSRVLFRNLMPVSCDDGCTTILPSPMLDSPPLL